MKKDKVYFAQKYGVPERDIVPEFLPVYIAFEQVSEQQQKFIDKVKGSIHTHQHYYDKGKPLDIFLARWGWGVWGFIGMLLVTFLIIYFSDTRQKLERLESVMKYDQTQGTYFIDAQHYKVVNDKNTKGIIINP